jgi:catechol 2,3-dioxygenase-like lactoylglutathione lyase family enzyme
MRKEIAIGGLLITLMAGAAFAADPARPPITSVSHLSVYTSDPVKAERFYVNDLGAVKMADPENPQGVRYYFSPTQFVQLLPLPAGTGVGRLDHVAFNTADAEGLRRYLASKKVAVPRRVTKGADGSQWFQVKDPEGGTVEFVQPPVNLPSIPANKVSSRIIHVGYVIHDRTLQDTFFRDILGFKPYWYGGNREGGPSWVSQQVPDGSDWMEYMIYGAAGAPRLPPAMTQATAGVMNHFALGVENMRDAYNILWNENRMQGQMERGQPVVPKIGLDAKWQLNLIDPDGTRAELMEFKAIGKPCCSPFTASDPEH